MVNFIVKWRNAVIAVLYKYIAKPIFFQIDPEVTHDMVSGFARYAGHVPLCKTLGTLMFGYKNRMLEQDILGIHFKNPVGLSAGFDKDARLTHIMPSAGFGFEEIGSITGERCEGNPKPRLWRLKKSEGVMVWYGLKNDGAEAISQRLRGRYFRFPVGISLAKTNSPVTCDDELGIKDYVNVAEHFKDVGDYFTINISCPNAYGGEPFIDKERLERLVTAIEAVDYDKPTFIKLSPDLTDEQLEGIMDIATRHKIDGFICTNLTKNRNNVQLIDDEIPKHGGVSGKPVRALSDGQIARVYARFGKEKVIIGVGGIFTAEDAYRKIRAGASLLQLITGMIYQGPQCISEINRGLVELLKRDGFANISEAVGADARKND